MACGSSGFDTVLSTVTLARSTKDVDGDQRPYLTTVSDISDARCDTVVIELYRRDPGSGIGVIVTGGADRNEYPRISQIKPGSLADRCDLLECGDFLVSVNGQSTADLVHDEIINLLRQAGQHLRLEVKFPLPSFPTIRRNDSRFIQKETSIVVIKENENFGMTIRGGLRGGEGDGRSPYFITRIRPGSPADRDGLFRVGDRITAVDGVSVDGIPHAQLISILRRAPLSARFTLQYDVQVIDAVVNANGPLYVEIDRAGARMGTGKPLGIQILTSRSDDDNRTLIIDSIVPASIADRCGALAAGDHILSIEAVPCENMTIPEAIQLIETTQLPTLNMLILPASVVRREHTAQLPPMDSTLIRRNQQKAENHHSHTTFDGSGGAKLNGRNNDHETQLSNGRTNYRNQSPPPLPRPPEGLYQQVVKEMKGFRKEPSIIKNSLIPVKSAGLTESDYSQSASASNTDAFTQHKDADDASSDGSFYEKTSAVEDGDPLSFLVTIERRKNEPWGIGFAYRRQKDLTDIQIQSLESGGIAQRTEALKAGDIVSSINGRPMRNQSLVDAYWQLNSYDIATLKIHRKNELSKIESRHSPNSTASVDSAVESWESNMKPPHKSIQNGNHFVPPRTVQYGIPQSASAHHVKEVESVSLRFRGSDSIPDRLESFGTTSKPAYREAENLKNSVEMMDQILSLNDVMAERRNFTINKPSSSMNNAPVQSHNPAFALDSLLEDLVSMRSQPQPATIRRVKFQSPNGPPPSMPSDGPLPAVMMALGKASSFDVVLNKDHYYEDFGFSLSDGAFERGVYVNRIRPNGPAEASGLKSCDQILTVNKTDVRDLDCCLAVPLIASSGDHIRLSVSRRTLNKRIVKGDEAEDLSSRSRDINVLESDML